MYNIFDWILYKMVQDLNEKQNQLQNEKASAKSNAVSILFMNMENYQLFFNSEPEASFLRLTTICTE